MADQNTADPEMEKTSQTSTVMMIDDDEDWIFISKRLLKKAGVEREIITAKNGLEALGLLNAMAQQTGKLPGVIFLDIKMPVMDGFDLLKEITQGNAFDLSQTKIYMCSSSISAVDKDKAHRFPISGFLTKPLTVEDLKHVLS